MADHMIIRGKDGLPKYEINEDNNVTDCKDTVDCQCVDSPSQVETEYTKCLVCGLIKRTAPEDKQ